MNQTLLDLYDAERRRIAVLTGEADYFNPVFGEGPPCARLMLIGEAPGAEEAKCAHPFVGKAGKTLGQLLLAAGIEREQVFITNAVKFRPMRVKPKSVSNRTPTTDEVSHSMPLLRQEILLIRPLVIATLGNTPLAALLRLASRPNQKIGEAHGKKIQAEVGNFSFTLFPLYHPASIIYNRSLTETLADDLLQLNALLKER